MYTKISASLARAACSRVWHLRLLSLALVAGGYTSVVADAQPVKIISGTTTLSASSIAQIAAIEQDAHSRTDVEKRLDSHLLYAYKLVHAIPTPLSDEAVRGLRAHFGSDAGSVVPVDVHALVTPDLITRIELLGGVDVQQTAPDVLFARLPIGKMEQFAALTGVKEILVATPGQAQTHMMRDELKLSMPIPFVQPNWASSTRLARFRQNTVPQLINAIADFTPPSRLASDIEPQTYIDSEGDVAHQATIARSNFSITGAGVKIGVLSDSDTYLSTAQGAGQLPVVTVIPGQDGTGEGEGTAMLEIVHDLAPGATLFFATANPNPTQFAANIRALRDAGCNIICDDYIYQNEPAFAVGPIEAAVEDVASSGVTYFSCAANRGNVKPGYSSAWEGDFVNSGTTVTGTPGEIAQFATGVTKNPIGWLNSYESDEEDVVDLFWSDPLAGSANDYNLYLLNSSGTVIDSSTNIQNGSQDPVEQLTSEDGYGVAAAEDSVVVVLSSGSPRYLHLDIDSSDNIGFEYSTDGNVRGHNAARDGICVGAVSAHDLVRAFNNTDVPETFSADGPRRKFYNPDGTAITPANLTSTGGIALQKPEFLGADGIETSVTGFAPFYGTSAATPHAAAIAGLLLQRNPSLTSNQLRTIMETSAIPLTTGWDTVAGYGILNAFAAGTAAAPTTATIEGQVNSGVSGGTETPMAGVTVFIDTNGDGIPDSGTTASTVVATASASLSSKKFSGSIVINGGGFDVGTGATLAALNTAILPSGYQATVSGTSFKLTATTTGVPAFTQSFDVSLLTAGTAGTGITFTQPTTSQFTAGTGHWTTTNSEGYYTLTNVAPGTYTVRIVVPTGYYQTAPATQAGIALTESAGTMSSAENFVVAPSSFLSETQNVLLLHSPDNEFSIWWLNGTTISSDGAYGPYPGWVPTALATGADTHVHLLENHTADNEFAIWNMTNSTTFTYPAYGPYSGWKAIDLTVTPDNHVHVLLTRASDNAFSIWDMASPTSIVSNPLYGPYSGWQALKIAGGPDGHVHVLLNHSPDEEASVWDMTSPTSIANPAFGPFSGWVAAGISVSEDNHLQMLWNHPSDGEASLWNLTTPTNFTYQPYGPYSGWQAFSVSTTSDNHVHLGWNHASTGAFSPWDITSPGVLDNPSFGPYSGWAAIEDGGH